MCIFVGDMNETIQIRGKLVDLSTPQVMGILNVTPDSQYAGSRVQTEAEIVQRCHQIIDEGASMIDVGAILPVLVPPRCRRSRRWSACVLA